VSRKLRMLAACECSGRVADAFARRGWEAHSCDLLPGELPGMDYQDIASLLSDNERGMHGSYRHHTEDVLGLFDWYHPVNNARFREAVNGDQDGVPLWDLVIAFPPCTHLSLAGARYWKAKREMRWNGIEHVPSLQDEAAAFFMDMVNAPAPHIAVENPRGDMTRRFQPPDQYVEPFWFGDPLKKKIGLWLFNLPLLSADRLVTPTGRVATGGGSHRTDIAAGRGPQNGNEDSEGRARRSIVRSRTSLSVARAMAGQWGPYLEEKYR
jgi:hypothetical protein